MAQGNSSNANRYKGEDIDTDGDGSVDDAQTLQGNQPSDLGNTIDGNTIQENSNGNIEVKKPSKTIVGDFETDIGSWEKVKIDDTGNFAAFADVELSSDESSRGTQSVNVVADGDSDDGTDNTSGFIRRDLDLTAVDSIEFSYLLTESSQTEFLFARIDGVTKFSTSTVTSKFKTVEIPTRGLTGTKTVSIGVEDDQLDGGSSVEGYIDSIKLTSSNLTVGTGAGN